VAQIKAIKKEDLMQVLYQCFVGPSSNEPFWKLQIPADYDKSMSLKYEPSL